MRTTSSVIKSFLTISVPITISSMIYFFEITITLYYISLSKDIKQLSAVGLGNMILTTFGVCVFYGLNGSVETLVSQANGANNMYMCKVYLKTGKLVAYLAFLPILSSFYGMWSVLFKLQQNPEIIQLTGIYLLSNSLGLLFFGLYDLQRRFLT